MSENSDFLRNVKIRMLKQSDILACPHVIFVPEHYRDDGTCKCNDRNEQVMAEWGYKWSEQTKKWESP